MDREVNAGIAPVYAVFRGGRTRELASGPADAAESA
jgi:hypothetical protein